MVPGGVIHRLQYYQLRLVGPFRLVLGSKIDLGADWALGGRACLQVCRAPALQFTHIYAVWTCRAAVRLQIRPWGVLDSW